MKYLDLLLMWFEAGKKISAMIAAGRAEGRDGLTDAELDGIFADYNTELAAAKAASARAKEQGR